ncbi:hypothetical protein CPB83DRAFT_762607, partial [Crepidotus variabilis]
QTIARIIPTTSIPSFVAPGTRKKKQDIKKTDLPPQLQAAFSSSFVPRLRLLLGRAKPWDSPTANDLKSAWSSVFPGEVPLDLQSDTGKIVKKLIEERVGNWRHKFASTALKYLEKSLLPNLPDDSKTKRAEYCVWAVSKPDDKHPFFYSSIEFGESDQISRRGIFQSSIIVETLAQHLNLILPLTLDPKNQNDWPHGALVMSILAVCF